MSRLIVALVCVAGLSACDLFERPADAAFGDQHFKTAIALVELHKIRHGTYPSGLSNLTHVGAWDMIALSAVEYRLLNNGYELNLKGSRDKLPSTYPPGFWKGLGLQKSNLKTPS